jgi:hypothetical protein
VLLQSEAILFAFRLELLAEELETAHPKISRHLEQLVSRTSVVTGSSARDRHNVIMVKEVIRAICDRCLLLLGRVAGQDSCQAIFLPCGAAIRGFVRYHRPQ